MTVVEHEPAAAAPSAEPTIGGEPVPSTDPATPPGAAEIDLLYSEEQEQLRASVAGAVAAHSPPERVLTRFEAGEAFDPVLWRVLAVEMGLAGLAVPEERGGAGGSFSDAALVLEELGRAVAPVPFLGSAVVATAALLACDDAELLGAVAAGERTAALAVPFSHHPGGGFAPTVAAAGGSVLSGTVTSVADALAADVLLVPTADGIYAVEAGAAGLTRTAVTSLDLTRQLCDLTLDGVPGRRLAGAGPAAAVVERALTAGAALLASEQLGVAAYCLDSIVEYAKTRYQFGRPVGSFQAVKHRLADVWVAVTQARAVARYAAACVATDDPDAPVAAALAQAFCSGVAVTAAEECVQLHGGVGFTWEHPTHLYLKRAKSSAIAFGTADRHRAVLARLVDLPGSPA